MRRGQPYRREVEWLSEIQWMESFWERARRVAMARFRRHGLYPDVEAPVVLAGGRASRGGNVGRGERIGLAAPALRRSPLVDVGARVIAHVPRDGRLDARWRDPAYAPGSRGEAWVEGLNGVGYDRDPEFQPRVRTDIGAAMPATGGTSVYVRIPFEIARDLVERFSALLLEVSYDDGFLAYLNGEKVAEANAPAEPSWSASATEDSEANLVDSEPFLIADFRRLLRPGRNLLALHGLNTSPSSSDFFVRAMLSGESSAPAPPGREIFFTTDGGDPAGPEGTRYRDPITIERTTTVRARARDGGEWSALTEARFRVAPD